MVVEPLSSVMTIQSQPVQKQVESRPAVEKTDVSVPEQEMKVDAATLTVSRPEQKDGGGADTQQNQQSNDKLKKAVEQLNKNMPHSEAVFGFHEKTNRVMIKIVDKNTKEVIKEFPPEETLDMIAKVWELAGLLVDEKR